MLLFLALPLLLLSSLMLTITAIANCLASKIPYKKFVSAIISSIGLITYLLIDNHVDIFREQSNDVINWPARIPALIMLAVSIFIQVITPYFISKTLTVAKLPEHPEPLPDSIERTLKFHAILIAFCIFYIICRLTGIG